MALTETSSLSVNIPSYTTVESHSNNLYMKWSTPPYILRALCTASEATLQKVPRNLELSEVQNFLRGSKIFQSPYNSSASKLRSMPNHSFVLLEGVHTGPYMDVVKTC